MPICRQFLTIYVQMNFLQFFTIIPEHVNAYVIHLHMTYGSLYYELLSRHCFQRTAF